MSGTRDETRPERVERDRDDAASDAIVVRIPPDARHLRVIRMVASTVASDVGYSIDDVDDVRMAADEVVAAVLEKGISGPITVTFSCRDDQLTMRAEGHATNSDGDVSPPEIDELRAAILGAVATEYSATVDAGLMMATFTKSGAANQ